MRIMDFSRLEDSIVIYFDTPKKSINAYTLGSTLVALADAAKAANSSLNPGHSVEIIVDAIGSGSFKVQIRALINNSKNIFSNQIVMGLLLGILGNYIYERTLATDDSIQIEIKTDEVIIQKGDERLVVSRKVYEATEQAKKNPKFVGAIERTMQAVHADREILGFGFVESMNSEPPQILVTRESIEKMTLETVELEGVRTITEVVDLQILKAILERGKRKWEFMWRGIKISAPITSEKFYDDFFNHEITIAPGDSLEVKLEIKQQRQEDTGIFLNKSYEVIEVYNHNPRFRQVNL